MAASVDHLEQAKKMQTMLEGIMETQKVLQQQQEALKVLCAQRCFTQAPALTQAPAPGGQQGVEGGASSSRGRGQPRKLKNRVSKLKQSKMAKRNSKQAKPKRQRKPPTPFHLLLQDTQRVANNIGKWHAETHPDDCKDNKPVHGEDTKPDEKLTEHRNAEKEPACDDENDPGEHSDADSFEDDTGLSQSERKKPCWNTEKNKWEPIVEDIFRCWAHTFKFLLLSKLDNTAKGHLEQCTMEHLVTKVQHGVDCWCKPGYGGPEDMVAWCVEFAALFDAQDSDAEDSNAEDSDAEDSDGEDNEPNDDTGMSQHDLRQPCWLSEPEMWQTYVSDKFHDWKKLWNFLDLSQLSDTARGHLQTCTQDTFIMMVQDNVEENWSAQLDSNGPQNMIQWSAKLVDLFQK